MKTIAEKFGAAAKGIRSALGKTQRDMSLVIGDKTATSTIARWESGWGSHVPGANVIVRYGLLAAESKEAQAFLPLLGEISEEAIGLPQSAFIVALLYSADPGDAKLSRTAKRAAELLKETE